MYRRNPLNGAVSLATPAAPAVGTTVSVLTYGADPTGVAISTTAFENAKTAAGVNGRLTIPAGTYRLNQPFMPLAGQVLAGAGIDVTILRLHFASILNFPALALVQGIATGSTSNPGVTVQDLTINGGRVDSGVANGVYTSACPDDYGHGIGVKVGWIVQRVRFTNINGHKCSVFGAHGAVIRDCVWDNSGNGDGSTSGERDQIGGGGGVVDLTIERAYIATNCVGSGIDITQGTRVYIRDCRIHAYSVILEGVRDFEIRGNYIGPLGGIGGAGGGGNINIKPNTAYLSSLTAGAYQPFNGRIIGNTIISSTGAPGICIIYSDSGRTGFPVYVAGGAHLIERNTIIRPQFLGVLVLGATAAAKSAAWPDVLRNNTVIDVIPGTGGTGAEYNSGAGYIAAAGLGISIGTGDSIQGNLVIETRGGSAPIVNVITTGARSGSAVTLASTTVSRNVGQGTTGVALYKGS